MEQKEIFGDRKTVFISHANPEDNYFAVWLSSKLTLLGYETWCDLDDISGGEDFWLQIDKKIREDALKFLFLVSKDSVSKQGTLKELAVADKITNLQNFIIPLRIDNIPFSSFPPEIIRLAAIDFSHNWARGLSDLIETLTKDSVPTNLKLSEKSILDTWLKSQKSITLQSDVVENYLTNWFPISLPSSLYIHTVDNRKSTDLRNLPYAAFKNKFQIITFACPECLSFSGKILESKKTPLNEFLKDRTYRFETLVINDTNRKVIRLINESVVRHLIKSGFSRYQLSSSRIFYIPLPKKGSFPKADLSIFGKRPRQLVGKSKKYNWHFAIGFNPFLYPLSAISVSHHVVFTRDYKVVNQNIQHKLRRKLSRSWYNNKWRDLLLATMSVLTQNNKNSAEIPVCCSQSIVLSIKPIKFESSVGYDESELHSK